MAFSYIASLIGGLMVLAAGTVPVTEIAPHLIESAHIQKATQDLQNVVGEIILQQAVTGRYDTDQAFFSGVVAEVNVSPGTVVAVEAGPDPGSYTLTATNPDIRHHAVTYTVGAGPNHVVVDEKEEPTE